MPSLTRDSSVPMLFKYSNKINHRGFNSLKEEQTDLCKLHYVYHDIFCVPSYKCLFEWNVSDRCIVDFRKSINVKL